MASVARHYAAAVPESDSSLIVRAATTSDIRDIRELVSPLADRRILLQKEAVAYYEATPDFVVAERGGRVVGAGAVHVLWEDLAEIRTLAVADEELGRGVGSAILEALLAKGRALGVRRLFCLTFETGFFGRNGFAEIGESIVSPDVYAELVRSPDEGVAEFLDLARVKPNTLGNTRMLKHLAAG